jgi:hypothetical protein
MASNKPKSKVAWLVALVERRSRRGWWAYLIWLLVYLPTAMMFAGEMSFHGGAKTAQMWPLLLPIVIIIVQWMRPTLLGWVVLSLPTMIYFGVGIYYLVDNNLGAQPQWKTDSAGVILGFVFLGALLCVCVALIFGARPRVLDGSRTVSEAVEANGRAGSGGMG